MVCHLCACVRQTGVELRPLSGTWGRIPRSGSGLGYGVLCQPTNRETGLSAEISTTTTVLLPSSGLLKFSWCTPTGKRTLSNGVTPNNRPFNDTLAQGAAARFNTPVAAALAGGWAIAADAGFWVPSSVAGVGCGPGAFSGGWGSGAGLSGEALTGEAFSCNPWPPACASNASRTSATDLVGTHGSGSTGGRAGPRRVLVNLTAALLEASACAELAGWSALAANCGALSVEACAFDAAGFGGSSCASDGRGSAE